MKPVNIVTVGDVRFGSGDMCLIAGPCVIETEEIALRTAEGIREATAALGIPVVYKSSYRKDNRSSLENYEGPGIEEGLRILERVRSDFGMPILSDIHTPQQAKAAGDVLDVIQIPAYLSQQTELLQAAAATGKPVNVKKGQFIAPEDMMNSVRKLEGSRCDQILLTERGASFGYRQLVVDFRSLPEMRKHGYPVIFDATHAVRIYGKPSADPAGGTPEHIPLLARAAVAAGCDGLFIETHPNPPSALCDASSQYPLTQLANLLGELKSIHDAWRSRVTT
ncbi:MAG: 3-deoxy-8-phosphooctulonate synthase [Gemmatimonadetes bacterium]|nr:3-deoxy-8-phosphooctulonate synthase [Gemmatimonadota bacterium]